MKKVLMGLTYYWPNISGVSVYAKILAEEMVKRGYEVEIVTSRFQENLTKSEKINGVKIVRLRGVAMGKGFLMWSYPWKSLMAVKRAEIINCHLPSVESIWLAIWAKIMGKKLIVTHHCEFGFDGPLSNRVVALISFPIHMVTYLLADKIVSYTKDYAMHSIFLRIFGRKIIYILPPIKI